MPYNLMVIFKCLDDFKKTQKKSNTSWHVKIMRKPILASINKVVASINKVQQGPFIDIII